MQTWKRSDMNRPTATLGPLAMRSCSEDLESLTESESPTSANAELTEDASEGAAAFFGKRRPDCRGR